MPGAATLETKAEGPPLDAVTDPISGPGLPEQAETEPAHTARSIRRRVLSLATPVIAENLLQTMLGIVDTLFVARLGSAALAGVGTAIQVIFFLISALVAVAIGSSILVAHAIGAGHPAEASKIARQSIVWSLILAIPLMSAGAVLARPIVDLFGTTPEVAEIAAGYLRITLATSFLLVLTFACASSLRGAGDTRTPLFATLTANAVNAAAAWVLIFGQLGAPALGSNGSAWAASIGRAIGASILLVMLWRGRKGMTIRGRAGWLPRWAQARRILELGVPAAVEQLLVSAAFTALTILIVRLGTNALAAQRVAGNAMSLSMLPGFGFAIAATALVGQSLGARRPREAVASAKEAVKWGVVWMSCAGVLFFFGGTWIMRAFSSDPQVIELGAQCLRAIGLVQPAWAVGIVLSGALRGSGNTRFPLVVNATTIWAAVILGWVLIAVLGYGLVFAWLSFVAMAPIAAIAVVLRFRRGDWQHSSLQPASAPEPISLG